MKLKGKLVLFGILLLAVFAAADTAKNPAATSDDLMNKVTQIQVGTSTGTQIVKLLGAPWRTTNYGDCHPEDYQEFWEYVGRDEGGLFRIQIEFDDKGVAQIVAKVPHQGPITVLASTPKPEVQHQH
jgi:hypothetical protein